MGSDQDGPSNAELMRAVTRIETKVDRQGEEITGVRLDMAAFRASVTARVDAIEDAGAPPPTAGGGRAKPLAVGTGLGAALLGALQWLAANWPGKGHGSP